MGGLDDRRGEVNRAGAYPPTATVHVPPAIQPSMNVVDAFAVMGRFGRAAPVRRLPPRRSA